jgi:hypothetical protein
MSRLLPHDKRSRSWCQAVLVQAWWVIEDVPVPYFFMVNLFVAYWQSAVKAFDLMHSCTPMIGASSQSRIPL